MNATVRVSCTHCSLKHEESVELGSLVKSLPFIGSTLTVEAFGLHVRPEDAHLVSGEAMLKAYRQGGAIPNVPSCPGTLRVERAS